MTMTTKRLRRLACSGAFILLALCTGGTQNTSTEVASGLSRDAADAKSLPFKAWIETRVETNEDLSVITFLDAARGWVGSGRGRLYQTADGGQTWRPTPFRPPSGSTLEDITFANDSLGWAALSRYKADTLEGNTGYVMQTADGGESWSVQHTSGAAQLYRIRFVDEREGWAVGRRLVKRGVVQDEPFVLHTTDQGAHWNDVSGKLAALVSDRRGETHDFVTDILASESAEATVLTLRGRIISTTDGGQSWRMVGAVPTERPQTHLSRLGRTQKKHLWVLGGADSREGMWGVLAYRGDSNLWTKYRSKARFLDAVFLPDEQVLVGGSLSRATSDTQPGEKREGAILHSGNGGRDWAVVYHSSQASNINALTVVNEKHIWAVGDAGLVLRLQPQ